MHDLPRLTQALPVIAVGHREATSATAISRMSFLSGVMAEIAIPMIPAGSAIRTSEKVQSVQVVIRNNASGRVTAATDPGPRAGG